MRNPLTIEAFAEWAEKMPADVEYDWTDRANCAFGQYAKSLGFAKSTPSGGMETDDGRAVGLIGLAATDVTLAIFRMPRTFGALATRLRASLNTGKART